MKYLLFALLLLAGGAARAQQVPYRFSPLPLEATTHRVAYAGTGAVAATPAAQLWGRLQAWPSAAAAGYQTTGWRGEAATGTANTLVRLRRGLEQYAGRLTVRVRPGTYEYRLTDLTYTRPDYARAGKHSTGPVTVPLEQLVYTRPGRARDRQLAEIDRLLQQLLGSLEQALRASGQVTMAP